MSGSLQLLRRARAARNGAAVWLVAAILACQGAVPPERSAAPPGRVRGELHLVNAHAPGFSGLGTTVVYLAPTEPFAPGVPKAPAIVRHGGHAFEPGLVAAGPEQAIELVNESGIHHRVFWLEEGKQRTVELTPEAGSRAQVMLRARGVTRFYCELHDEEYFSAFVAASPYFAVLDSTGPYELDGVPAGTWGLSLWSEPVAGPIRVVQVSSDATADENIWIDAKLATRRR